MNSVSYNIIEEVRSVATGVFQMGGEHYNTPAFSVAVDHAGPSFAIRSWEERMASRVTFHLSILSIAAGIVTAAGLMPATALAQAYSDAVVFSIQNLNAAQVQSYWTPERMGEAQPTPLPTIPGTATGTQGTASPAGPPIVANSGRPGDTPRQEVLGQAIESATEPLAGTYPFSYSRYRLFPDSRLLGLLQVVYKQLPYQTIGKLFFTIPGQGDFVCSGASINSNNLSVVWTTGHCLYTPGIGYHSNVLFSPARRAGADPFGTWPGLSAVTTNGWANSGLREFDLGALVVNRGGTSNLRIGEAVGFLGFIANTSRQQHWHIPGYPAAPRDLTTTPPGPQFDGEHQEICTTSWATNDQPSGNPANPQTIGIGCDQTGGVSGAPYLVNFSGVGGFTNLINGQATYRYSGPNPPEDHKLFSPYFGDAMISVLNAAQAVPVP